ncbi:SMC-Scp complex subunit ScpB [Actinosynnema sp. ALI-1.44]|uniref:SMC-Scp complex subunit ScpB n=1 Tax=Actinosynnema sp. ALI-1.44 TaxID=1933779 RepID=UPI0011782A48|nr:SMC-Scp complex subunit ScpB [Actinosynnema sp. ALI-1.44]
MTTPEQETADKPDQEAPAPEETAHAADTGQAEATIGSAAAEDEAAADVQPDAAASGVVESSSADEAAAEQPDAADGQADQQFVADAEPSPDAPSTLPLDIPTDQADDTDEDDSDGAPSRFPNLTEDEALHSALEALLLVVDSPAEVEDLADALSQPVKRVRAALKTMAAQYHEQNRGIDLRDVGGGWRFYTRDKYAPFVEKLLHDGQRAKLTRAALESLAVIAYRQPVTRARVAAVRGVNVDGVIRTLLVRGLIEETGTDKDTGGILYRTTELFLERLGLSSLEDLPPIAPLLPEVDAIDDV